jgi:hypothetical protein
MQRVYALERAKSEEEMAILIADFKEWCKTKSSANNEAAWSLEAKTGYNGFFCYMERNWYELIACVLIFFFLLK